MALSSVRQELDQLTANTQAQQTLLDGLEGNAATQASTLVSHDGRLTTLESNSQAQQTLLDGLEGNAATQAALLVGLESNAASQQAQIEALATGVSTETVTANLVTANVLEATDISGNGYGLYSILASNVVGLDDALTYIDATSANIDATVTANLVVANVATITDISGNGFGLYSIQASNVVGLDDALTYLSATSANINETVTANLVVANVATITDISGNGFGLYSIQASNVVGLDDALTYIDATSANISDTVTANLVDANVATVDAVTANGLTANGVVVTGNVDASYYTGNGYLLEDINAAELTGNVEADVVLEGEIDAQVLVIGGNLVFDVPIQLTTGNATHPSLAHADETSTGLFFEDGGNVVYTANGGSTMALESGALVPRASGIDLGSSGNAWANAYVASVTSTGDISVHSHTVGRGGGGVATNVAVGNGALASNTTGLQNTASGYQSLLSNTTGSYNTASGESALRDNTTGTQNTASGDRALLYNTTGTQNTASGVSALRSNTTGSYNTASGVSALRSNTTGSQNTAIGALAHYNANIATNCVAVGYQALYSNTTGSYNTASGVQALLLNTTGSFNTASGAGALRNNTTGSYNMASGVNALYSNTTGSYNTASGRAALELNTTGWFNTASGVAALYSNTTGSQNTASGESALRLNTTGSYNTASGQGALMSNTTGTRNTASGVNALHSNSTGSSNMASGVNALFSNTTGSQNTASGRDALRYTTAGGGANYTNTSGLGYNTRCSGNNQVQLGDSNTTTYAFGSVQNRSDRRDKADIEPNTAMGLAFVEKLRPVTFRWDYRDSYLDPVVTATIDDEDVTLEDGIYDTDLGTVTVTDATASLECTQTWASEEDVPESLVVDGTTLPLRPETTLVPQPKDGSRKRTRLHHGLIAQEVEQVLTDMGLDNLHFAGLQHHSHNGGEDVYSLGYTEFVGPLIRAVQELKALCDTQAQDITNLRAENDEIRARLDALEP